MSVVLSAQSAVVLVVTLFAVIVCSDPVCNDIELGRLCRNITPDRVYLDQDHLLFVGSTNYLYTFDTKDGLTFKQSVDLFPKISTKMACATAYAIELCENYIRIVQPIPSTAVVRARFNNTVLVCGTNAYEPRCRIHNRNNITDWFFLTNSTDVGFSPYSPDWQNVGLLISNGRFFSATVFDPVISTQLKIAVAPNGLLGDTTFIAGTSDNDPLYLNLGRTEFVSLYEIGDYVFLFAREVAIETENSVLYSRVFRICKTDNGIMDSQQFSRFLTFQKVRLTCPQQGGSAEIFDYDYDEITATFIHWPSGGADPLLYAAFGSARNGPVGTAICKFDFNANTDGINAVFESAEYLTRIGGKFVAKTSSPFSCPGSNGSHAQRGDEQAVMYQLINGEVLPIDETALHTKQGEAYTKIVVDVFSYNNIHNEAMFIGTSTGEVRLVLRETTDAADVTETTVTIFSDESDNTVTHLMLDYDDSTGIRQLLFATSDILADIILGNCSKYISCVKCLESRDLYCIWQNESKKCANKLLVTDIEDATEAIKGPADAATFCGVQSSSTSPSTTTGTVTVTPPNQVSIVTQIITQTSTIFSVCTDIPTLSVSPSPGGSSTIDQSATIGKIVGSLVGGLLLGIVVGSIVYCVGLKLKRSVLGKSTNSSPSHSPTALNTSASINNHIYQERGVVQYSIPIVLPEKQEEQSDEKHPPPAPSVSPPMIDIELDDDVICDIASPTRAVNTNRTYGRTLSTRPLMASSSDQDP